MKLRILQTSDIHAYLYPTNFIKSDNVGLLSLDSKFSKLKQESDFSLIIDSGDLFVGSPLVKKDDDDYITKVLNEMKYDIITPGNHDFNLGKDYYSTMIKNFNGEVLCANIKGSNFKKYQIYEFDGLKIAVVGFITPFVTHWEKPEHILGLEFIDIVESYQELEQELVEQSDLIIVNYHGGLESASAITNENQAVALANFKSIDLILTGHQHNIINESINNTTIVQPGVFGRNFSMIDIDLNTKNITAKIIENEISDCSKFDHIVLERQTKCLKELETVIAKADSDLVVSDKFSARKDGHPLINFIHEVQLSKFNADISVTSLFDSAIGFEKAITQKQVYMNYPFPNTLVKAEISGKDLKKVLEIAASYFEIEENNIIVSTAFNTPKLQNYNYDMFYGINYEFNISKPVGSRLVKLEFKDKNVVDSDSFSIIVNNYRFNDKTLYTMYENCVKLDETADDMNEILSEYFINNPVIKVNTKTNYIISK